MKFLLLLSFVVFVASRAEGLKCRCSAGLCDGWGDPGTLTCADGLDACFTTTVSYGGQSYSAFGCGIEGMEDDCGGTYGGVCTCTTDLCN